MMADRIQVRRDTEADWTSNDPTLASGEPGHVSDDGTVVVGDGSTAYSSLTSAQKLATQAYVETATSGEGFRAYRSTTQSLSASTWTTVVFDTEERDDGGDYNTSTGEWTVPETRWYDVAVGLAFTSVADGELGQARLMVDGVEDTRLWAAAAGAAGTTRETASVPLHLTAGDVVTVMAWRVAAGDIEGSQISSWFTAK